MGYRPKTVDRFSRHRILVASASAWNCKCFRWWWWWWRWWYYLFKKGKVTTDGKKALRGSEGIVPLILSLETRRLASRSGHFNLPIKSSWYSFKKRLKDARSWTGRIG